MEAPLGEQSVSEAAIQEELASVETCAVEAVEAIEALEDAAATVAEQQESVEDVVDSASHNSYLFLEELTGPSTTPPSSPCSRLGELADDPCGDLYKQDMGSLSSKSSSEEDNR